MTGPKGLTLDTSAIYKILVQGYLDEDWADCLGPVDISVLSQHNEAPVTAISGEFQDQAALAGALSYLYQLGLPLLSVECIQQSL